MHFTPQDAFIRSLHGWSCWSSGAAMTFRRPGIGIYGSKVKCISSYIVHLTPFPGWQNLVNSNRWFAGGGLCRILCWYWQHHTSDEISAIQGSTFRHQRLCPKVLRWKQLYGFEHSFGVCVSLIEEIFIYLLDYLKWLTCIRIILAAVCMTQFGILKSSFKK